MANETKARMVEDFLGMPDRGWRGELVLGELVDSPHPSQRQGRIAATLCWLVRQSIGEPHAIHVVVGHPIQPATVTDSLLFADVAVFVGQQDVQAASSNRYSTEVPAVVFEVVDDWDNAYLWHDRMTLFPRSGVAATISVWPNSRKVTVFSPDRTGQDLRADEQLDLSSIVPGVRFPVAAIFG